MKSIYVIGSLRGPSVPAVSAHLRKAGLEVFDDWYAAGPEADDKWKEYEQQRGKTYQEALDGYAAGHVFDFDRKHLERTDGAVLVLPAGRSGHLELGYVAGLGKPTYILLPPGYDDSADRWDVMYRFASKVVYTPEELIREIS